MEKEELDFGGGAPSPYMRGAQANLSVIGESLLDSRLIVTTKYNAKLVVCGDYVQLYQFENERPLKQKDDTDLYLKKYNQLKKMSNILNGCNTSTNTSVKEELKIIENKNINRSKLECQRLAKSNVNEWHTFITLTFENNITDIDLANRKFRYYIDKIQRVKKDFKYLCIPEFQKRGAVHYHLLTNLKCDSEYIPKRPLKRLYNPSSKTWKELEYYDLKYWYEGYSSAEIITGNVKKIIGYISKYMTKDIDNRLFNRHRYFYSRNLNKQKEEYLDLNDPRHIEYLQKIIQNKNLIYDNEYQNIYNSEKVAFMEFL